MRGEQPDPEPRELAAEDAATRAAADAAAARVLAAIAERGDRWMSVFLALHTLLALALAPVHGTWAVTLGVVALAVGGFALSRWRQPRTLATRTLAGIALQAFCALHIHQLHGLAEMHFFYFTATTAMVIYKDWRAFWPGILAIVAQHTLFSWWHNAGVFPGHAPFFEPGPVTATKLGFHFGIALAQAAVAAYWAVLLRRRTVQGARAYARLAAGRDALAAAHAELQAANTELETAHQQLQQQAVELELQSVTLARVADEHDAARRDAVAARARMEAILGTLRDPFLVLDADGRLAYANDPASALVDALAGPPAGGRSMVGRALADALPGPLYALAMPVCARAHRTGALAADEGAAGDGWFGVRVHPSPHGLAVHLQDLGPQRRAEAALREAEDRLRQSERLEAMGRLAGGVAHDFNNLLTVITANLAFARDDLPPEHPAHRDLADVADAAERARRLVRQLLTFTRRQPVQLAVVDMGTLVHGAAGLLERVLGEEIALAVHVADGPLPVLADASQLEQVLVNLAVNARDAMLTARHGHAGGGGALTLEVDAVTAADEPPRVRLIVRDTGHGMDAETQAQAFEPFFTTKPVGAGTGLGLATTLGVVTRSGGRITVDSAPGAGTTFTILLPYYTPVPAAAPPQAVPTAVARTAVARTAGAPTAGAPAHAPGPSPAAATILLVEDEQAVRVAARRTLARHGYTVIEARHGGDALLLWATHAAAVDVLVTDLRMPELGGRALAARLRSERPDLPVVFLSGYPDEGTPIVTSRGDAFLDKPFAAEALLDAVRRVGDAAARR